MAGRVDQGEPRVSQEPTSVEAQLAVINTKLDLLIAGKDDHELRLRRLEQFKYVMVGAAAATGGVAGSVATKFFS